MFEYYPQTPHKYVPYGKDGTGSYSENNTPSYPVSDANIPLIVDAVQTINVKPDFSLHCSGLWGS